MLVKTWIWITHHSRARSHIRLGISLLHNLISYCFPPCTEGSVVMVSFSNLHPALAPDASSFCLASASGPTPCHLHTTRSSFPAEIEGCRSSDLSRDAPRNERRNYSRAAEYVQQFVMLIPVLGLGSSFLGGNLNSHRQWFDRQDNSPAFFSSTPHRYLDLVGRPNPTT